MPLKLSTIIKKINLIPNKENAQIVLNFLEFMNYDGKSERHQINNLNTLLSYSNFLGKKSFFNINIKDDVISFLNTKIKSKDKDPEQKWITTYNDYFNRIKHFLRWFYNQYEKDDIIPMNLWKNPSFIEQLKPKETKRLSPYAETEIWEKDEFLSILK